MTNILARNSDKKIERITAEELAEMKNDITLLVNDLKLLQASDAKDRLRSFRFGSVQNSLLHLASELGDDENLAALLKISADDKDIIDAKNSRSFTALHLAARNGFSSVVDLLIQNKANPNSHASAEHREWTPIHYAARHGHVKVVSALINAGVDKEEKTGFGLTPLLIAAEFGQLAVIEFLLSIGVNKNAKTIDENYGMNALHYAAVGGHLDVVLMLLKAKINRNNETNNGLDALDFAAKIDDADVASILLIWGVGKMERALEIAARNKDSQVARKITKYIAAKKNFFNAKWLHENEENLLHMLQQFTHENLDEAQMMIMEVGFNAYGIFALEEQCGFFFKKKKTCFLEFCEKNNLVKLSSALKKLQSLAVCNPFKESCPVN